MRAGAKRLHGSCAQMIIKPQTFSSPESSAFDWKVSGSLARGALVHNNSLTFAYISAVEALARNKLFCNTRHGCTRCVTGSHIMPGETPAETTPDTEATNNGSAHTLKPEVEYDDFGLPIRKPRAVTPVVEDSDSEDEKFEDAVAIKSPGLNNVAMPEAQSSEAMKSVKREEGEVAVGQEEVKVKDNAQPQVNGHVKQKVVEIEQKEEAAKALDTQSEVLESMSQPEPAPTQDTEKSTKTPAEASAKAPEPPSEGTPQPQPAVEAQTEEPSQPSSHRHQQSIASVSEYSHQHAVAQPHKETKTLDDSGWQTMPAYARYDMYDDDDRLIAKENVEELEDMHGYGNLGGAAKGYTRVIMDDDADSVTSMDDNTAYLFKDKSTMLDDNEDSVRDPLAQMQATKDLLTEGQRVAYVGLVRLAMVDMEKKLARIDRNRNTKKVLDLAQETTKMWSQKVMVRVYGHMDITTSEQVMIEQLSEHGVVPADLVPALMQNARVKNPLAEEVDTAKEPGSAPESISSPRPDEKAGDPKFTSSLTLDESMKSPPPPPYKEEEDGFDYPDVRSPSQMTDSKSLDIDLRWTVMCDLFLVLITDGVYDARSRELFEQVGKSLSVDWLEVSRFEKRITDALEMQEQADKENWNEGDHMKLRAKRARNRRLAFMGIATVGGGLVIGLSAGLLAPLIGAGLAAGFSTIGVAGTGTFLAGAGGAAIVTTTGVVTGGTVGVRAANRRTGAVKTFEYRPLHNNKRTNLIITLAGWMNGKVDDVRLPYSTVDPVMGDIYSVLWEPEMLRSMGDTINILATEVCRPTDSCCLDVANRGAGSHTRSSTSAG